MGLSVIIMLNLRLSSVKIKKLNLLLQYSKKSSNIYKAFEIRYAEVLELADRLD